MSSWVSHIKYIIDHNLLELTFTLLLRQIREDDRVSIYKIHVQNISFSLTKIILILDNYNFKCWLHHVDDKFVLFLNIIYLFTLLIISLSFSVLVK